MLDDRQAVVSAKDLATQEFDAGHGQADAPLLVDLVFEFADLGLFHLHRAEFDALVDRDATDVVEDPFAAFDGDAGEFLERLARGGDRFVGVGELAQAAMIALARDRPGRAVASDASENFLDNIADNGFVNLHDYGAFEDGMVLRLNV